MITREQLKMARAGLSLGVRELADQAGVTANTISRYENGADAMGSTLEKLKKTLESAGIEFLPDNGVRLRG